MPGLQRRRCDSSARSRNKSLSPRPSDGSRPPGAVGPDKHTRLKEAELSRNEGGAGNAVALTAETGRPSPLDVRFRWVALLLGLAHLCVAAVQGLRWEHAAADGVLIVLPWIGP